MKTSIKIIIAIILIVATYTSCKKSSGVKPNPLGNLPPAINGIVSPATLKVLKTNGTVINEGISPPPVEGTYLLSPDSCTFDNSGDSLASHIIADYTYKFSNQNNTNFTVGLDYNSPGGKDAGSDAAATFISGSGNMFSIFAQTTGVDSAVSYKNLQIISGEVASNGIKNLQITNYLVSKTGDANNIILEPAGSIRIFADEDLISENLAITNALPKQRVQSIRLKSMLSALKRAKNN